MDLGKRQRDYAVYLPAISSFYTKQLDKICNKKKADSRVPAGFEHGNEGLDFLKADDTYYHYPYGLYSAGHAHLDINKSHADEPMIQERDRNTVKVILGDSGGFQIATGVMKMDWANAKDPNDPARTAICEKILRWLEHTADWSMTLDIPAFAAVEPLSKKTGLTEFSDTLDISLLNLDYFVRNRVPGATKFLNVLSGTDEATSKEWYEAVKCFSEPGFCAEGYGDASRALEGYAFAGINMKDLSCVLNRVLDLRADGLLEGKDWIHFLGTSALEPAVMLTAIKRQLQKVNPNLEVSFDSASAFVSVARGLVYTQNEFDQMRKNRRFGFTMDKAKDNKKYAGSTEPYNKIRPGEYDLDINNTPVMNCYTEGDICCRGVDYESKTSWDSLSYVLLMAHNVYQHIEAVQEANRRTDNKDVKSIPENVLEFVDLTERVFASENPMDLIEKNSSLLNRLSKAKFTGAPRTTTFDSIVEEVPALVQKEKKVVQETASNFANLFD